MAECFCGCGRAVSRFPLGIRTINRRGKMVSERLEWARAYEDDTELFRQEFFKDGSQLVAVFRTTVHGEVDPEVDDAWVRELMGGLGPERFEIRQKIALDFLEQKSGAWMKLGRDLERTGVQHGRAIPIKQWLKGGG
jgi:hypothetical protein